MNILLFTLEYPPFKGGVANYYENIIKHWPIPNQIFVLNNNKNKLINKNLFILKWLPSFLALRRVVKEKNIKHIMIGNILPLGTVALILSKIFNFQYSLIIHGTDIASVQTRRRKSWLAKFILNNAKNIICNSSYVAKLVKKQIRQECYAKIAIVNPGVEINQFISCDVKDKLVKKYKLKNKIILFSIGRLIKRKGVDKVIEVIPEILKQESNLIYIVAGVGKDEKYLKSLVKKNVIFLGKISEEEKWALFDLCDIFVQPVRAENNDFDGFGIVYLEANLIGKPVIAGRSGGVMDAVQNRVNGLLVNPESSNDIKNAILKLVKNKKLRKKLGEQGKEWVKNFEWKKQIKKIYKIF